MAMVFTSALLQSARVDLRPVTADDLPDLLAINGDPEVTRHLPYETWRTLQDGSAWLQRMEALHQAGTGQQLVVVSRAEARCIGTVLLFKFDSASARLELGYVLGRRHWGKGYMREALTLVGTHLFGAAGVRRIEAEVNPDNLASNRLLLRLGFTLEGRARERWVAKGQAYDTNLYGLLAHEWPVGAA